MLNILNNVIRFDILNLSLPTLLFIYHSLPRLLPCGHCAWKKEGSSLFFRVGEVK